MVTAFQSLENKTLRGRIADAVRAAILSGSLPEGSRLVERELALQFATSLTAVREALIQLETEGFVVKKANATTHVIKLTPDGSEKIFAVRRVLETFAVEQAAQLATPTHLRALEKAFLEMLDAARKGDPQSFVINDYLLHETIWAITGNEYLQAALKRITPPVFAFAAMRLLKSHTFDLLQDANSHVPLLEAIQANNPESARNAFLSALDKWLENTRRYVFGAAEAHQ